MMIGSVKPIEALREVVMTLQEIIADIHALHEDIEIYERKYGILSETFFEVYQQGRRARR
jgi:hypothetical protein